MKREDIDQALAILASQNAVTLALNVPITDSYSNTYDILILESNVTTINDLHEAGFSLSMTKKGLNVNKF